MRHLEGAPDVEVAPELSAEKNFRYDLQDLEQLDLPLLRNLMERHRVPFDLEEDLSEDDERRVALRSFADAGWMRGASKTPPKPSEGAKQMPAKPENTTEPAQTTTAASASVPSTDAGESGESETLGETPSGESCEAKSRAAGGLTPISLSLLESERELCAVQARLPGQRSRRLRGEGHDPGPKPRPKQTRSQKAAAMGSQISRPARARVPALEAPEVVKVMRLLKRDFKLGGQEARTGSTNPFEDIEDIIPCCCEFW